MLDFAIYNASGNRIQIPSAAQGVTIAHGRKGPAAAAAFFPLSIGDSFQLYNSVGQMFAVVSDGANPAWRGRVEDIAIQRGGVRVGAFGLSRAMDDTLYTALWSVTTSAGWQEVTDTDLADRAPERYAIDNNNRLYLALANGETYKNTVDIGELTYAIPHGSSRNIVAFAASYDATLPTDWQLRLIRCDDDFTNQTAIQTITGTGSNATGTITQTFTGQARLLVQLRNNTGSDYTMTGTTGAFSARLTGLRIKSTTAATVLASDIAAGLVASVQAVNAGQIDASMITATKTDLQDEIYQDQRPAAILDELALREGYEWGVDENGVFFFRPRGAVGRSLFVDAASVEFEDSLGEVTNSVYARYKDGNSRILRTAAAINSLSQGRYGITRQGSVSVNTTSATQAAAHRDAMLTDKSAYAIRAKVDFYGIYDSAGNRFAEWDVRPGDRVTIRNLSPILATDIDNIGAFRVDYSRYDTVSGALTLEPDAPIPTLVTLIARQR